MVVWVIFHVMVPSIFIALLRVWLQGFTCFLCIAALHCWFYINYHTPKIIEVFFMRKQTNKQQAKRKQHTSWWFQPTYKLVVSTHFKQISCIFRGWTSNNTWNPIQTIPCATSMVYLWYLWYIYLPLVHLFNAKNCRVKKKHGPHGSVVSPPSLCRGLGRGASSCGTLWQLQRHSQEHLRGYTCIINTTYISLTGYQISQCILTFHEKYYIKKKIYYIYIYYIYTIYKYNQWMWQFHLSNQTPPR